MIYISRLSYYNLYCPISNLYDGGVAGLDAGTNKGGAIATYGTASLLAIRGIYGNLSPVINTFHLHFVSAQP